MKDRQQQKPQPHPAPPPTVEDQPVAEERLGQQKPETLTAPDTYPVTKGVQPEAIVIYCGQPDLQDAFHRFITEELGLVTGQYVPFVVAGGAGALARPSMLPKEFKFMKERLELFRDHYKSIRRVILINHEDCAYYKGLSEKLLGALPFHPHLPQEDMTLIAKVFTNLLSHLGVQLEMYYAKYTDPSHTRLTFDRVV